MAGSVGPLGVRLEPLGKTGLDEARAAFAEQIRVLAERRACDLLIVETMPALNEARKALQAAQQVGPGSARAGDGDGGRREQLPGRLFARARRHAADRVGRERHRRELLYRADHGADRN